MSFRVNTNVPALFAQRQGVLNKSAINRSIERLASGSAINRAADDAAGLAISERMRSQVEGLQQGSRNVQDGISLLQTAEGGVQGILSSLQRMRTLAVQSANDTLTNSDRALLQIEMQELTEEMDRQSDTVNFNGRKLLNGLGEFQEEVTESYTVTSNIVNITNHGPITDDPSNAQVHPDGDRILYTRSEDELATMDINGGPIVPIPNTDSLNQVNFPTYSPDGSRIAFTDQIGLSTNIHVINVDGSGLQRIADVAGYPRWFPDGEKILFTAGVNDIRMKNADGTGPETVLVTGFTSPADIHPDGNQIVYGTAAGLNIRNLTTGANFALTANANDQLPVFSPDGSIVFWTRTAGLAREVFMKNADGSGPEINLSNSAGVREQLTDITPDLRKFVWEELGGTEDIFSQNTRLIVDLNSDVVDPSTLRVFNNGVELTQGVDYTLENPRKLRFTTASLPTNLDVITSTHSGAGLIIHDGANRDEIIRLSIPAMTNYALFGEDPGGSALAVPDITSQKNASKAITEIDRGIELVTATLAEIGAQQNRLDAAFSNNQSQTLNASASRSRIRDLDFASEIVEFTKRQILEQAGMSALQQANVAPQAVLQLLQ